MFVEHGQEDEISSDEFLKVVKYTGLYGKLILVRNLKFTINRKIIDKETFEFLNSIQSCSNADVFTENI